MLKLLKGIFGIFVVIFVFSVLLEYVDTGEDEDAV